MAVVVGLTEMGKQVALQADDEGRLTVSSDTVRPLVVRSAPNSRLSVDSGLGTPVIDGNQSNVVTIGTASALYTLPVPGGRYILIAVGDTAFIVSGAAPTATVGGAGMAVPGGAVIGPLVIDGPQIAYIGRSSDGVLYIVHCV